MALTLDQQARTHDNDYSALEEQYRGATGGELVVDPYGSPRHPVADLTLSASVVIPAWNAHATLEACLVALEQSSFNRTYPERLEVVVVDDGSTDGTWELLQRLQLDLRLRALRQTHHSRAHTQNTGIAVAEGDVVICCDSDMILAPFSIEELVKRHQVLDRVMLLGFRGDVDPSDPRIRPEAIPTTLSELLPPYPWDVRLDYRAGGWPESMCRDTDHLKRLGAGTHVYMADGSRWDLPSNVWGALFSLRRADFMAMGGYDERFYGWGCEDTLVGWRALALGVFIVPVYGAAGWHIAHGDRSPRKWQEFAANRRVFHNILRSPFTPPDPRWVERARARIQASMDRAPAGGLSHGPPPAACFARLEAELANPDRRGKYLMTLGRYDEAAAALAEVRSTPDEEAWAAFDRGKALRAAGRSEEAVAVLENAAQELPTSPWPSIELALALAGQGAFGPARQHLEAARSLEPSNPTVAFLLRPVSKHLERAALYARQGHHALSVRDYEAALILDPTNTSAWVERAAALCGLGRARAAREALASYASAIPSRDPRAAAARLDLARLHLALDELGPAKVVLEEERRQRPRDPEVGRRLAELDAAAARAHPLPLPRSIVQVTQAIPGWMWPDEAELLVALAVRAAASARGKGPPVLVDVGCYCGRSTVTMGLAARSIGREGVRVVAVDEPSLGPAPDGRPARAALREALTAHGLADLVILAPEDEPEPWTPRSQLVLVDGQHDYASVHADVERYASRLAAGGLLVFHDYASYFPDVQRCVDELLVDAAFAYVAHVGSLIALARTAAPPAQRSPAPSQGAALWG